jgi:hypothetical protein
MKKVKSNKIAHDIADAAMKLWTRKAAKLQVEAQEVEAAPDMCVSRYDAKELREQAHTAELLARDWKKKAHLALYPVTETQVLAMLKRLPAKDQKKICDEYGLFGGLHDELDIHQDFYVGIFNECVNALTPDPLS